MNKKIITSLIIIIFFFCFISNNFVTARQKETIAVAEFVGKNVSQMDASIVSDFVRSALVEKGEFKVVSRGNMEQILSEQAFQMTGCTDQDCAVQIGKLLNAKKIIIGSLSKLAGIYYITINLVEIETGEIVYIGDTECESPRGLKTQSKNLAYKMVDETIIKKESHKREPKTTDQYYSKKISNLKIRRTIDLGLFIAAYVATLVVDFAVDSKMQSELLIPIAGPIIYASQDHGYEDEGTYRTLAIVSSVVQSIGLVDYLIASAKQGKLEDKIENTMLNPFQKKKKVVVLELRKNKINLVYNLKF